MPPKIFSRHLYSEGLTDLNGNIFLTDRKPFRFVEAFDNRYHTVTQGDTLHSITGAFFSSFDRGAGLWWVIADFQKTPIHDPTIVLEPGRVIAIPSDRLVREEIFNEDRRRETGA